MILVIDNYDSFTYNLVHYLGTLGAQLHVLRNDELSVEQAINTSPDAVLISPGPCDPPRAGICLDLIPAVAKKGIPLLGICLGHQSIGMAFGGSVIRAPQPIHGKTSQISHKNIGVFTGLPTPFKATRYHSLIIDHTVLPECLDVTATSEDDLIMGVKHKTYPIQGVQFHPESIASEHGMALLENFMKSI